jgi:hypothetical protein
VLDKKNVRSKVWRPKPKADDKEDDKPQVDINTVVFLPKEFMAPIDSDTSDEEHGMAQLTLKPKQAIFKNPEDEKRQHLKALFLKGFVNVKLVTKMLVDGGATINLMSYTMLHKIGKSGEDLTQTDMMLVDFEGNVSLAQGAIYMELTICKTQGWTYDRETCISGRTWDTKYLKVSDFGLKPVQVVGSDDEI